MVLAALVWLVFGQTIHHDFVNIDDPAYVYKNPRVTGGLRVSSVVWAFTHSHAANWHPLTWLSHMLDCQLYGLNAGGHHLTNVLLHAFNAILLFVVLRTMTGSLWRSAFTAALFAIHPLRIESVAWVSERKDLLSGAFFLLTVWAYLKYARQGRSLQHYLWVIVFFGLGLLSKPMLVTVPLVLLLIDYWPLRRMEPPNGFTFANLKVLFLEKMPLVLMAVGSCLATIVAQKSAMQPLTAMSLPLRLGNALISCLVYVRQMFWPDSLAAFYPLTLTEITIPRVLLAAAGLVLITAGVLALRRRRYLVTGWFWYLIMLGPVIGIVQVGGQAHADRYTYLPQIGLAFALVWGVTELLGSSRFYRPILGSAGVLVIAALTLAAHAQGTAWKDSETLWTQALARTSNNLIAELNLAEAVYQKGKTDEAIRRFERALQISGSPAASATAHSSLGVALLEIGRPEDSLDHLRTALTLDPSNPDAHYNLGNTLLQMNKAAEAVTEYQRALAIDPDDSQCLNNAAWTLATWPDPLVRDGPRAVKLAEQADSLTRHSSPIIGATLAAAYAESGRFAEAIETANRAIRQALADGNTSRADSIRAHLRSYEAGSAFRERH
ncbi:MAG: tetratricopeptide repeat protein [Chthoniobacterales bacterium]